VQFDAHLCTVCLEFLGCEITAIVRDDALRYSKSKDNAFHEDFDPLFGTRRFKVKILVN
jgi:hypothetical protein